MKKLTITYDYFDQDAEDIKQKTTKQFFRFNLGVAKSFKESTGIDLLSSKNDVEDNMTQLASALPAFLWVKIDGSKLVQNEATADEALNSNWYDGITMDQTIELIKLIQPDDNGGAKKNSKRK